MVRSKPSLSRDFKQNLRTTEERERAFLVGIDYRRRTRLAQQARDAALARREREASATEKFAEAPPVVFGAQESLDELRELTLSAGGEVAGEFLQSKDKPDPATVIGKGKLEEISAAARSAGAQLVIFDHDLSATAGTRTLNTGGFLFDVFTLGVIRAGNKFTESTLAFHQLSAVYWTLLINGDGGCGDPAALRNSANVLAFGIAGAAIERAEAAAL